MPDPALAEFVAPELLSIGREIARRDLLHEINAIKQGWEIPTEAPVEVVETAQRTAELDAPVTIPLQSYRAGHRVLWAAWRAEIETLQLPAKDRNALLEQGAAFFFDYADRCSAFVVEHYTRYRDELTRARTHRRYLAVNRVLNGQADQLDEPGYDFARNHLAVVLVGDRSGDALARLAQPLGTRPFAVPLADGTAWAWFSTVRPPRPLPAETLASLEAEVTVGIGELADGVEGFRRTHRQARQALEIALRAERPFARYCDVAAEALAGADDSRARDFVAHELSKLDDGGPTRAPLRQTLRAYFAAGANAAETARVLGVHERTIAYRLKLAEERLGVAISNRRTELDLALRLEAMLRQPASSTAHPPAPREPRANRFGTYEGPG
jgi:DNA-binding PucR family transcriptional regulator